MMTTEKSAKCAILSDEGIIESSLMGTKDAYLNLVSAILSFVHACSGDQGPGASVDRLEQERAYWDDTVKKAFRQLPAHQPFIVGAYLFDDHVAYLHELERRINPLLPEGVRLKNDPDFSTT